MPDSPTPPREHRQPPLFGAVVTLVVLLLLFVGLVEGVRAIHGLGYEPAATAATTGPNLSLEVFPDSMVCHGAGGGPHPEWVTYCPSTTLKVPAYSTITVHILQYDSSTTLHNYYFSQVSGTVGGTMTVNGRTLTRIDPRLIGAHIHDPDAPGDQGPAVRQRAARGHGRQRQPERRVGQRESISEAERDHVPVQDRRSGQLRLEVLRAHAARACRATGSAGRTASVGRWRQRATWPAR